MDFNKIKENIRRVAGICGDFIIKNKRYVLAVAIFICMNLVLFLGTGDKASSNSTSEKSSSGVYKEFKENNNEALTKLISDYYVAYAAGDTDTIQSLVSPSQVSDQEVSYIKFYSQYIEEFQDIQIFTKQGLSKGSYLVSIRVNLKYNDIATAAPGLDFFYVQTQDDKLYIDNTYGSFNQNNNVVEMDTEISDLISVYIRQQDLLDKQAEVTSEYNAAIKNDSDLNTFMTISLPDAIVSWNTDYNAQLAAAAEAEAQAAEEAAKAEEEAKAKAEEEAKAAEEEANSYTGKVNSSVNVRESADKTSNKLGKLSKGDEIKIYGEEGDFYKFDYNGTKAYVTKSAVKVSTDTATEDTQETTEETTETTTTTVYNKGDKVTLSSTVNIRSKMDSSASKVAVAYAGEEVEVVMSYAEGWTKVKYKSKEGFIRTDLLK